MQVDMERLSLWCDGRLCGDIVQAPSGVAVDVGAVRRGDAFIALRDEKADGHNSITDAFAAGAVLAIVEDETALGGRPGIVVADTRRALGELAHCYRWEGELKPWVGVTGSNGKSTTRHMLAEIFRSRGEVCEPQSNQNNLVTMPLTILNSSQEQRYGVLELGAISPGEIERLSEIAELTIGIVTCIAPEHLNIFGSLEGVAREKAAVFSHLPADGLGIYPAQAPHADILTEALTGKPRLSFAVEMPADFVAEEVHCDPSGCAFVLDGVRFKMRTLGRHNIGNAVAAVAAARHLGVPINESAEILAEFVPLPGRLQINDLGYITLIDDSYNANPISLRAGTSVLSSFAGRRRVLILGDMQELGEESLKYHSDLGAWLSGQDIEVILAAGQHNIALAEAAQAQNARQVIRHFTSTQALLRQLEKIIKRDDVVMVKGSRHMRLERAVTALWKLAKDNAC